MACACLPDLSSYNLTGAIVNAGGAQFPAFTPGAEYGPSYGIGCGSHDDGLAPFCDRADSNTCDTAVADGSGSVRVDVAIGGQVGADEGARRMLLPRCATQGV